MKYTELFNITILKAKDLNENWAWGIIKKNSGTYVLHNKKTGKDHPQYFTSKDQAKQRLNSMTKKGKKPRQRLKKVKHGKK